LAWCCTVDEAKQRCTLAEFRRWSVYEGIEPFGDYRLMEQNASLMARVFNATRGKHEKRWKFEDFMPSHRKVAANNDTKRSAAMFEAFAAQHNAMIKKKSHGNINRKT
jgi:hypothetical protein